MFENILLLIFSYFILLYLGIGIFQLISPDSFRKPYLYALVAPGFGLCLLTIIGSWVMAANMAIIWTMVLCLIISTCFNLLFVYRSIIRGKISLRKFIPSRHTLIKVVLNSVLLLGILFLLILPGLRENNFTTPLRIGPDAIGHAGAAQALVDGETLSSIAEDLKAVTGEEDLEEAKKLNFQLLRFDLHCSSEFLLRALRWGYPTILASMTWITGMDSVYRLDFILLIFSWAMLAGLAYYACRTIIKARWYICTLLAGALILNCNLLNICYEGSYSQVVATPVLFMLLLYLYEIRKNNTFHNVGDYIKPVAFAGFLCASLMSVWNEAFIILGIICFIILVLDLLFIRKTQKTWIIIFGFGAVFAFILIVPLTWNLILFYTRYLFTSLLPSLNQGGWWQPQWAALPEIMGWLNIYAHGSPLELLARNTVEILVVFFGSLFIIASAECYLFSNTKPYRSLWISPFIFVASIYIKTDLLDHINNYQYYKAYAMFLPVIFLFIYASIFYLAGIINSGWKYAVYGIIAVCIGMTAFNGISYLKKYYEESSYFTEEMFDFQDQSEKFDDYVLMTPYGPHYFQTAQMAGTQKFNWYNFSFEVGYGNPLIKKPYLEKTVAIIIYKNDPQQVLINGDIVMYSGEEFQVVKTPYKLKDRLDEDGNVDINNYSDFVLGPSIPFENEAANCIAVAGNVDLDTRKKIFGTASGSFSGIGDYLTVANSADFDFASEDFTIDGWFYFNANNTGYQFLVDRRGKDAQSGWIFYLESNNQLSFLSTSDIGIGWDNVAIHNTGVVPETGIWMHLAVVRNGDVFTMYQNGKAIKSGTFAGTIAPQKVSPTIGAGHANRGNYFNGYMDELRISKGIARWTADFTPPDAPYEVDSYTKLLLHFDIPAEDAGAGKPINTESEAVIGDEK